MFKRDSKQIDQALIFFSITAMGCPSRTWGIGKIKWRKSIQKAIKEAQETAKLVMACF